jgi:L-threonylcarbamoyladenylate synthase
VIDAGPTMRGIESTIIACVDGQVRQLRPGPIAREAVADLLGITVGGAGAGIEAPGQLASHYAPSKPVRLNATERQVDEWLIGFGSVAGDATLSAGGDLVEAAARLFDALHVADVAARARIAVAPVPDHGLGAAINDRLRRAAVPG